MPYIDINTTIKIEKQNRDNIKSGLGEIISIIPGKSESVLMIGFNQQIPMYYSGEEKEQCAFIEIKIHGSATPKQKQKVIENCFLLFEDSLDMKKEDIFITISEFPIWGFQGNMV